ncbi:MAG: hypothetical protein HMLKMBBP_01205 [Planctomycetes bacterium]|nr:hypothetical protein [Planctomycetota bacterium]
MRGAAAVTLVVAALAVTALVASSRGPLGAEEKPGRKPAAEKPPAAPPPPAGEAPSAALLAQTADVERRTGLRLATVVRGRVVVRGDAPEPELVRIAETCNAVLDHFLQVVGGGVDDVFGPLRGEGDTGDERARRVEVFQFVREKEYLAFVDRYLARIRDDTVDDRRLALLRRQRGFFIRTPRLLMAQYQGPSDPASSLGQAAHKTSHLCALSWNESGAWSPWWLLEGFGAWQEMAALRECRTYCLETDEAGVYAKSGTPEADEAAKARMADAWRKKAAELVRAKKARDMGAMARLSLNEITHDDVVVAWSFVTWLHRERKLAAFLAASKAKRDLEPTCTEAFGVASPEVERRWHAWLLSDAK